MIPAILLSVIISIGLSWVIIHLKSHWYLKLGFITLSLLLSASLYVGVENFKGWPTSQNIPEEFKIEWIIVVEPSEVSTGVTYLWLSEIDHAPECYRGLLCLGNIIRNQPRAYALEYSDGDAAKAKSLSVRILNGEALHGLKKHGELSLDEIMIHDINEPSEDMRKP